MGLMQMFVQLGLNATAYQTGLKQAQGAAENFGSKVTSQLGNRLAGIFTLGAMEEGIRRTVQFGSKIQDLHERTGISTDDLQKLDFAAGQTGASLESMVKGVERLGISMARAKAGDTNLMASLNRLGLSETQVNTLSAAEAFHVLGDSVKGMSEITGAVQSDLRDTMGRGALELIPAMRTGIRELGDDLANIGGIIDAGMIAKLDEFDDRMAQAGTLGKSVIANLFGFWLSWWDKIFFVWQSFFSGLQAGFGALLKGDNPFEAFKDAIVQSKIALDQEKETEKTVREERAKRGKTPEELEDEKNAKAEQRELEQVAKLHERIAEVKRKASMEGLSDAEKLARLEAEIAQRKMMSFGPTEEEALKGALKTAEMEAERDKLRADIGKKGGKDLTLKPETNALVSIGNILGVDPNRPVVDKLEVVHVDLQTIIRKMNGESPLSQADSEYPT